MDWNKYREDFLWFSYFGVTKDDVKDNNERAIMACAERAYLDLSRTIKYTYSTSEIEAGKKSVDENERNEMKAYSKWKESYKAYINRKITDEVLGLLNGKSINDKWYKKILKFIVEDNGEKVKRRLSAEKQKALTGISLLENPLSYGQSQKWVNMTIKNLLIMGIIPTDDNEMLKEVHIPLDSYIFKRAKEELKIGAPKTVWSQLNDEEYYNYQKKISEVKEIPIAWEGDAWINQAKAEKNKTIE